MKKDEEERCHSIKLRQARIVPPNSGILRSGRIYAFFRQPIKTFPIPAKAWRTIKIQPPFLHRLSDLAAVIPAFQVVFIQDGLGRIKITRQKIEIVQHEQPPCKELWTEEIIEGRADKAPGIDIRNYSQLRAECQEAPVKNHNILWIDRLSSHHIRFIDGFSSFRSWPWCCNRHTGS